MNRTRLFSLALGTLGLALLLWLAYDASEVATTLGLDTILGEAGTALLGLAASGAMLLAATALPVRQWLARRRQVRRASSAA